MAFVIDLTRDIDAPAEVVWQILTDFAHYREWNPFVLQIHSTLEPGSPIDMCVQLTENSRRRQREWILTHTPGTEFSYRMKPIPVGALRSRRTQTITALDADHCRYRSHFEITGWLQPVVTILLGKGLRRGFTGMADGIEQRARQLHS